MKTFKAVVQADKWPESFDVQASNWRTAAGRAVSKWQKKFKGSRATSLSIKLFKVNTGEVEPCAEH